MSKYIFRNEKGGYESAYDKNSLMKLCYEEIADLEAKLAELNKEPLNCSQLENGMSLCVIQKSKIAELEDYYSGYIEALVTENIELKQQLEESEKEKQHLKEWLDDVLLTSVDDESFNAMQEEYENEIEELKQQLAEKEKEIKVFNKNWNKLCDYLGECIVKYDKEDFNGIYSEVLSKVNELKSYDVKAEQDKIDFAVAELEKVKSLIIEKYRFDVEESDFAVAYEDDIDEIFNQQIKELKRKK